MDGIWHLQDKEFEVLGCSIAFADCQKICSHPYGRTFLNEPVRCEDNVSIRISELCRHDECAGDKWSSRKVV